MQHQLKLDQQQKQKPQDPVTSTIILSTTKIEGPKPYNINVDKKQKVNPIPRNN